MSVSTYENNNNTAQKSGRKNIWSIDTVTPDPHRAYHVYVVHILEGHFNENDPTFYPATKHKTRCIYARMTDSGKLENVFPSGGLED